MNHLNNCVTCQELMDDIDAATRRPYDDPTDKIPGLDDGQWTSNIEQTCDRVISLVRPIMYKKIGEDFGNRVIEGPDEILISVLKQKLGPANFARWAMFQPEYNKLDELEKRHQNAQQPGR